MQYKCEFCQDTGSKTVADLLDCVHCDTTTDRIALNKWLAEQYKQGTVGAVYEMDAWRIHQRALAMAPKQEAPAGVVAWMSKDGKETTSATSKKFMETCGYGVWHEIAPRYVIPLVAAPAAANGALTDEHVSSIARYLSDFTSSQCNVDKDDAWKIYGDDEIERMRAALTHAGVALSGAKGN